MRLGWTTASLGEVLRPAGRRAGEIDAPVYSVTKHRGFVPSLEYFNKQVYGRDLATYKLVERGDFAYATIHLDEGSIGIAPERALISPMYTVFRPDVERVDPGYLIRYMKSERALADYSILGSGSVHRRRSISLKVLGGLEIPLPPLDEQRRISAVLDHVDALRMKRQSVLERIEDGSVSIFLKLFGQESFEEVEFGELLGHIDSGKSPVCLDREAHGDEWSVLKLGAISTGVYRDSENKALKPETAPGRAYEVRSGDLLFSRKNTIDLVGMTVLVRETAPRRLLPDLIFRLVPAYDDAFDPVYIEALFRMPQQRRRIQELAGGSAASMVNISKKRLMGMPVPTPPLALQREFADTVGHLDAIRGRAECYRAELDTLFASLQSRAFAGELDVSNVVLPPGM